MTSADNLGGTPTSGRQVPSRGPGGLASALYRGTVVHRRIGSTGHRFSYQVAMALIFLEELDELCGLHPWWSHTHLSPVWFRRGDYLGHPALPLEAAVRDLVAEDQGVRPCGPIAVLTHPRTWGWSFNPITCYYCMEPAGDGVEWMVAEVTSTPWHERHCYVVGPPGTHQVAKAMHVSPFLGMDLTYRLEYSAPRERLGLGITVEAAGGPVLFTQMRLHRQPADRHSLGQVAWHPGLGTIGVTAGIYRQALALWRRGTRFHPHPDRSGRRWVEGRAHGG